MKQEYQLLIYNSIRLQLKRTVIKNPVYVHCKFYEINKQRDPDNIAGVAHKFILDSLQKCQVIANDVNVTVNDNDIKDIDTCSEKPNNSLAKPPKQKTPPIDYESIKETYNKICVSLPKCQVISEDRKKAINKSLKIYTLDDFTKIFTLAEGSDFLKAMSIMKSLASRITIFSNQFIYFSDPIFFSNPSFNSSVIFPHIPHKHPHTL